MSEPNGESGGVAMKFFLDSANLDEIRGPQDSGLIDGVTTNPSLIVKEGGVDFKRLEESDRLAVRKVL